MPHHGLFAHVARNILRQPCCMPSCASSMRARYVCLACSHAPAVAFMVAHCARAAPQYIICLLALYSTAPPDYCLRCLFLSPFSGIWACFQTLNFCRWAWRSWTHGGMAVVADGNASKTLDLRAGCPLTCAPAMSLCGLPLPVLPFCMPSAHLCGLRHLALGNLDVRHGSQLASPCAAAALLFARRPLSALSCILYHRQADIPLGQYLLLPSC